MSATAVMKAKEEVLRKTVKLCKDRNILIPTFAQMKDPGTVPAPIRSKLKDIGL